MYKMRRYKQLAAGDKRADTFTAARTPYVAHTQKMHSHEFEVRSASCYTPTSTASSR